MTYSPPLRSTYQDHHLWGLGPLYVDSGELEHSAHNRDPHITSLQTPFLQERDNPTGGPSLLSNPDHRSAYDISHGSARSARPGRQALGSVLLRQTAHIVASGPHRALSLKHIQERTRRPMHRHVCTHDTLTQTHPCKGSGARQCPRARPKVLGGLPAVAREE